MYGILLICMLANSTATFEPSPAILRQFKEFEYPYKGGRYNDRLFRYRLRVPEKTDPGIRYPLLVWLHGGKERGNDNRAQLRWLDMVIDKLPRDQPGCFILAIQVPSDVYYWIGKNVDDDMLTVAKAILDDIELKYPVDQDRIYLAGVSSGGTGCWEMAMRYPDTFAAVAPMASQVDNHTDLDKITNVPIWTFHSQADHPKKIQQTVKSLHSLGGSAYLTLLESDPNDLSDWLHKHDCWRYAIRDCDVVTWLFRQERGSPIVPPPGHEPWNWSVYSVYILVLMGTCMGGWFVKIRIKNRLG